MTSRIAALALLTLVACTPANSPEKEEQHPVVKMAMFDLDCPEADLHFKHIDKDTWGVKGCGKRAKYVRLCHGLGRPDQCRWVQN